MMTQKNSISIFSDKWRRQRGIESMQVHPISKLQDTAINNFTHFLATWNCKRSDCAASSLRNKANTLSLVKMPKIHEQFCLCFFVGSFGSLWNNMEQPHKTGHFHRFTEE